MIGYISVHFGWRESDQHTCPPILDFMPYRIRCSSLIFAPPAFGIGARYGGGGGGGEKWHDPTCIDIRSIVQEKGPRVLTSVSKHQSLPSKL